MYTDKIELIFITKNSRNKNNTKQIKNKHTWFVEIINYRKVFSWMQPPLKLIWKTWTEMPKTKLNWKFKYIVNVLKRKFYNAYGWILMRGRALNTLSWLNFELI